MLLLGLVSVGLVVSILSACVELLSVGDSVFLFGVSCFVVKYSANKLILFFVRIARLVTSSPSILPILADISSTFGDKSESDVDLLRGYNINNFFLQFSFRFRLYQILLRLSRPELWRTRLCLGCPGLGDLLGVEFPVRKIGKFQMLTCEITLTERLDNHR